MSPDAQRDHKRYMAAMHGVQSAIAFEIERTGEAAAGANPKHLRTGINSCLVDSFALSQLLMAKGVFTEDEYFAAIADAAEREVAELTKRVREKTGLQNISFG